MAQRFAVTCLLFLSSGVVKLLAQQASPPLIKVCTNKTQQDLIGGFTTECHAAFKALDFSNVGSILNVSMIEPMDATTLCSEVCLPSLTEFLSVCYYTTPGFAEVFERGVCLSNEDGKLCFTAILNSFQSPSSDTPWVFRVWSECFINLTISDATPNHTETCTDGCRCGLQQGRDELGCCMDAVYNNTFVRRYLPFAEYSLWSKCRMEAPGFCSSALALSVEMCILVATTILNTILF